MSKRDNFDFDKIGQWFIEESGDMSYRQVSDAAPALACFGYQVISYELVREVAKERLWADKRREFQAKKHGGIIADYQESYAIITKMIVGIDADDPGNARDLASLGQLQLKYGEAIMAINPPSAREDDVKVLSRDDVLQILVDTEIPDREPVDYLAETTP